MTFQARKSTNINRSIEQVWPHLAETERELQWRSPYVLSLEVLDDGPVRVGSRVRGTTRIAGSTQSYVNEVTELTPPRRYAWRGVEVTGPVNGFGSYELEPTADGGTRVTLDLTYIPQGLMGRLQMPALRWFAPRILRRFLIQLDEVVRAEVPSREVES
jgi:Predicted integral membrane protein